MTSLRLPRHRLSRRRALGSLAAILAPTALTGARADVTSAQETTPMSTPIAEQPSQEVLGLVQSVHPEKVYFYLPGFQDETLVAETYGLDVSQYQAIKTGFAAAARGAAEELLVDTAFAAQVDRLPFQPDDLVVVIGESDTDDLQSWFEILRHVLELQRPRDGIRLENLAVSGQPTTVAFGQLIPALSREPDWILCGLGGNDAVRSGLGATKTVVSLAETELNLTALRHVAAAQSDAEWVWLTRWSIDDERIAACQPFKWGQCSLRGEDFDAVSEVVRRQPGLVVDLGSVFGRPPNLEFLREDGLHPSLAGQKVIARAVVEQLPS